MQFRLDMKSEIENITSMKVYPIVIPNKAEYPAIQMKTTGGGRNTSSGLTDANIRDYSISLTICASTASECYVAEQALKDALDEKPFKTVGTNALVFYYSSTVELYNYTLNLFEVTIDFSTKILRGH